MASDQPPPFIEWHPHTGRGLGFRIARTLASTQSEFQKIEIHELVDGSRLFTLDDIVMLTTGEEWAYHEMIVHVPLFAHPNPRRVLIIGGGDGGTAREALRHPSVEHVDLVDIDPGVFEIAEQYLPATAAAFADDRLHRIATDGARFVEEVTEPYDVVVVDSTDPIGPGAVLFSAEFYAAIERALGPDGLMTCQSESPYSDRDIIQMIQRNLRGSFPTIRLYLGAVPFYPSGLWTWTLASKRTPESGFRPEDPLRDAPDSWGLHYYSAEVHRAAFTLPPFVRRLLD